jgi:uncharacterized protein YdeI (YjbR/CyaY-like superfamily)
LALEEEKIMLTRKKYPMPNYIKAALLKNKLMKAYLLRPPYQQNDYIGWINRAMQEKTRQKRLDQMIAELKNGDSYMKMTYKAKKK